MSCVENDDDSDQFDSDAGFSKLPPDAYLV